MAYFTQHKRSSVPFLCPLRTPSTVCAYIHEKFALFYYILFSMCTRMQYNGSQRPAFGSLFSRVCLLLLCSQLSDMQCPWVHSFTADSSSWLLGLKLRCRPSQMPTFMSLDVYSGTARPHSSSSRLTNLHLTTVWKSLLPSCPREHLLLFYWWQLFRLESDGISLSFWLYFLKAWLHWVLFYIFIAYLWSTYLDHLPNFQSRLPSFHLSALARIQAD